MYKDLEPARTGRFGPLGPSRPGRPLEDTFWSISGPPEATSRRALGVQRSVYEFPVGPLVAGRLRCPEVGLGIPNPTSGRFAGLGCSSFRCPEVGLQELENRIPNPTSGHETSGERFE